MDSILPIWLILVGIIYGFLLFILPFVVFMIYQELTIIRRASKNIVAAFHAMRIQVETSNVKLERIEKHLSRLTMEE